MATKLVKDLIRESSVKIGDREINITISGEQKVILKLKGMKTGEVSISIEDLWHQLKGTTAEDKKPSDVSRNGLNMGKNNPMISLYDIRTYNAISGLDYETVCKFEGILKNLIDNYPEKFGS